jgi:hypothetical protein
LEYPGRLAQVKNPTMWNGIQPSEKWPDLAGQNGWTKKKSPLSSGLESISLEEIEETGTIVLRRTRIVQ